MGWALGAVALWRYFRESEAKRNERPDLSQRTEMYAPGFDEDQIRRTGRPRAERRHSHSLKQLLHSPKFTRKAKPADSECNSECES
ncbi:MAG: hypothetical protein CVV64_14145 [Candidatus Wallbacteria bacterium HGW-Wallbacteria-1]|uniref:Uncharacterized protein n=1 Tax=Candidatus Wallbacteria bacterium HGW-Wallbacteria-1 TaxID=2013854 RepID=A0A2N1PMH8_9BACT|nr:MAG: hypothetical protein CVV64_14145 [Candidatus Wallbacteria bacterium HGW-Wallbacteria-1]